MGLLDIFRNKAAVPRGSTQKIGTAIKMILPSWLRGDYTLKNSELIFSATSRIANALSAMPIRLYKGTAPQNTELNDLVNSSPNPNMTSCQFFKTMEACRCTYGNCYALKIVDHNFTTQRLDILDPSRVTPILNEDSNELWYEIRPERGEPYYIHSYYVIHIPFISTNGYSGINPVSVLLDTLQYAGAMRKFSVEQLEKGVNASIILEAPANLGEDQQKKMIEDLLNTYKDTSGNIVLLESGVTAKSLDMSPVDTKVFEVEKITRGKVAMVYNLPPHLLGDYSDTSFATMEQQMLEFLSLTMLPIITAYEQELNKKLLTQAQRRRGYRFRFNMDSILRADAKTMAEVHQKAVRGGWITVNEIRMSEGKPRIKSGDVALVSRDLTTLDFIVNHPDKTYGGNGGSNGSSNGNNETSGSNEEGENADALQEVG